MPEHQDAASRLGGKAARKALVELYGESDAGVQAERYARLAEAAAKDAPGSELRFYSAPGRTELGGNHTDHNGGRVLCAAVRLDAVACVAPRDGTEVRIVSDGYPDPIVVDLADLTPKAEERGRSAALVRGVARGLADRGIAPYGFTGRLHSTVLQGSGLSSSAAIEVLLGVLMADLGGTRLPPVEIAKIGQFAENEYFGKPCGLMDQTASAVGGVVSIDFADPGEPRVKRVDFDFEEEGYTLVVVNTGGSHADLTADYAAVPAEMKSVAAFLGSTVLGEVESALIVARGPDIRASCGDRAFLRALHFFKENDRVTAMVDALKDRSLRDYFRLVKGSGDSSWRLLQDLYAPGNRAEQGLCVALSLSAEFLGKKGAWRVHGGGFAGTIQAYVPQRLLPGYTSLMERYFGPRCVLPVSVRPVGAVRVFSKG